MKQKKTLLIAFFLMLFVFQQAQAGTGITLNTQNSFQLESAQASGLPPQLSVTVLHLDNTFGTPLNDPKHPNQLWKCTSNDSDFGCVEPNSDRKKYPYGNSNPASVPVETDYLLNVLPREMDIVFYPASGALWAQALAARSFADWAYHIKNANYIDNSTNNQIFVPHSFEYYTRSVALSAPTDPCNESGGNNNLNILQQLICNAVVGTHGQYVSYGGSSMFAGFGSDTLSNTVTYRNADGTAPYTYLKGVQDPISTTCGAINNGQDIYPPDLGKVYGMSQKGASRWAFGNQCANQTDQNTYNGGRPLPWSLRWFDYRQILAHYYTGIDILDANGSRIAPDDRWNLLKVNASTPLQLTPGGNYQINLFLQNTSTSAWGNDVIPGYQWTAVGAPPQPNNWLQTTSPPLPATAAGEVAGGTAGVDISFTAPSTAGVYTLHLDLSRNGNWFTNGSSGGWPDAQISPVLVDAFQISLGSDDAGPNPVNNCAFFTSYNEVYLGACYDYSGITSGFRFQNIPIQRYAPIQSAYMIFSVDGPYNLSISVQIYGELNGNSVTFSAPNPPSSPSRPTTSISVPWSITDAWGLYETRQTPELKDIIQEIVNQGTWNAGNSLSIIFKNDGSTTHRRVIAFERASWDPNLHPAILVIVYTH